MKVIFTAFNKKLVSKVMELPENTTDRFRLPLDMDELSFNPKREAYDTTGFKKKIGVFQMTRYSYDVGDGEFAKEYKLVDIE